MGFRLVLRVWGLGFGVYVYWVRGGGGVWMK